MRRYGIGLLVVLMAWGGSIGVASASKHVFKTWSPADATKASSLIGSSESRSAKPSDPAAAFAYANRVSALLADVQRELGSSYVSAALDPNNGNRLVVHVTTMASGVNSPSLESLDAAGGEVRIVEREPSRAVLESEVSKTSMLIGSNQGNAKIVRVSIDDLSARVVVYVDRDPEDVRRALGAGYSRLSVEHASPEIPVDGGTWGNNPARAQTPVPGGSSIAKPANAQQTLWTTCSGAVNARRGGARVLITAGHCVAAATAGAQWRLARDNNGLLLGATIGAEVQFFNDPSGFDIAAIANNTGAHRDCVIVGAGCRPVSYRTTPLVQNSPVWRTGARSGDTLGLMTDPDAYVHKRIVTNICTLHGDSGGVLWRDNGDGTVDPIGVTDTASGTGDGETCGGAPVSSYTNWQVACHALSIDTCPVPLTSNWYLRNSNSAGTYNLTFRYGITSYQYLACDWDGDGVDENVAYEASSGTWVYQDGVGTGGTHSFTYGYAGTRPVCGDWNNDGTDDVGVFDHGYWYLRNSFTPGAAQILFAYGSSWDIPVVGDWDGVGADGIGIFEYGNWYLRQTASPGDPQVSFAYGYTGALPVTGNWDGLGGDGVGVFDPNGVAAPPGYWLLRNTASPGAPNFSFTYGAPGYLPVVGDWDGLGGTVGTDTIGVITTD